MDILPPRENTVEYPGINIFLPYTQIQPATLISLIGYNYTPVKLEGEFGYSNYFKKRWEEGKTFINIEHDIIPYPGAIEAIWNCPEEWCVYDMHLPNHRKRKLSEVFGIPPGCMKVSSQMIQKTKGLWDEPLEWSECDQRLTCGQPIHQHFPSIVNANPALMGFVNIK